jgi:autotransporter passenger strand-loop-strand repeat protein
VTNSAANATIAVALHAAPVTLNTANSFELVTSGGSASGSVITNGAYQDVFAGGTAIATKVGNGGHEHVYGTTSGLTVSTGGYVTVYSGGGASNTTIAGGTLEVKSGGSSPVAIHFTGSGGEFIVDSPAKPTVVISGFAAGDKIELAAVKYAASDTVTVKTAGVVTVSAGGKAYNLNIAGAKVGETDFVFSTGSILTKTASAAVKMAFIAPAATPAGGQALPTLAELISAGFAPAIVSSAIPPEHFVVSSGQHYAPSADLLSAVHRGGVQVPAFFHTG